jgi:hypothetical protein
VESLEDRLAATLNGVSSRLLDSGVVVDLIEAEPDSVVCFSKKGTLLFSFSTFQHPLFSCKPDFGRISDWKPEEKKHPVVY